VVDSTRHKTVQGSFREVLLIAVAFALWVFMFRDYLSSKLALFDDAVSYYDHVKFYLDNISRGVFPLWDPLWFCGAANNFFLQRMGCFNPFILVTLVFKSMGVPYTIAYLMYLAVYYFVGCVGFYLLARLFLKDKTSAFVAFFLLLFSALGTRIFDSYMILMFTPIVWFFYFLVSFSEEPKRHSFVGIVFTLVIIFTTYLPFYFLIVLASFLLFHVLFYGKTLRTLFPKYIGFAGRHKILVGVCAVMLLASLTPGYLFFKSAKENTDVVMPARNTNPDAGGLGVQRQDHSNSWAILEEIFFARDYYTDMTQIKFAILYVPLFAYLVFFLGFFTRSNKKLWFLFTWSAGLLILSIPAASPVYGFFYDHVILFKYFRNLHFLLWVALLPIACLLLAEQLKSFLAWQPNSGWEKWAGFLYVSLVHGVVACYLYRYQFPIMTSYGVLILSYVFFLWRLFGSLKKSETLTVFFLLLIIAIEPIEVYAYLSQNTERYAPYAYDHTNLNFHYTRFNNNVDMALGNGSFEENLGEGSRPGERLIKPVTSIYYASKWYGYFISNIDYYVVQKYRKRRFIIYDAVERLDDAKIDLSVLETALAENRNVAFVSTNDPAVLAPPSNGRHSYYAQIVEKDSEGFKVVAYSANGVKIKTNFSAPKFLVYNDNYHSQWSAFLNGHRASMVRANAASKGLWVPAGEQVVEFKFGTMVLWALYMFLFVAINGMFIGMIVLCWQESRRNKGVLEDAAGGS